MSFLIKKRTDHRQDIMRDGAGHSAPLKYVDGEHMAFFEHMPAGVDIDHPDYLVVEVDDLAHAERWCREARRTLRNEIFERPALKPTAPSPPDKLGKIIDAIKGLTDPEKEELSERLHAEVEPPPVEPDPIDEPTPADEPEPPAPAVPFADLGWRDQIKAIEGETDPAELIEWASGENSPAVAKALDARVDELDEE